MFNPLIYAFQPDDYFSGMWFMLFSQRHRMLECISPTDSESFFVSCTDITFCFLYWHSWIPRYVRTPLPYSNSFCYHWHANSILRTGGLADKMAAEPVKGGLGRGQEWQDLDTQPEKRVVRLDGLVGVGILNWKRNTWKNLYMYIYTYISYIIIDVCKQQKRIQLNCRCAQSCWGSLGWCPGITGRSSDRSEPRKQASMWNALMH